MNVRIVRIYSKYDLNEFREHMIYAGDFNDVKNALENSSHSGNYNIVFKDIHRVTVFI